MYLGDLTDEEWEMLETHIVRAQIYNKTASAVLRQTVNGALWRMRTGSPWRFVPSEYGNWSSIRRRFQEWDETGLWSTVTAALAELRRAKRDTLQVPLGIALRAFEGARPQP